jgi:peptide/nickel transport system substrate-binding protein
MAPPTRSRRPLLALLPATAAVALVFVAPALLVGCRQEEPPAAVPSRPLRIATYSAPLSLDPHFYNEIATFSFLGNIFEALVRFDSQLSVEPALATSWENPNDLTWRFRLRPGVRFHDGRPLTADDVVASLERARTLPKSGVGNFLVGVEAVRKVDAATIEITTLRPTPVLLNKLCFISVVPADAPPEIVRPVGTGPYRLAEVDPGKRLVLEASSGWWGGVPAEPVVEFVVVTDAGERVARLVRGEVDLANEIDPDAIPQIEACEECRVAATEGLVVEYLQMRVDVAPFSDLRVRRAVHLALDREAIVAEQLSGQGAAVSQLVGRQVFGHDPEILAPRRDLAAARRLLAEAGLPDGFDSELDMRQGRRAETIVRQLGEAGIRLRPNGRPWAEVYERLQKREIVFYLGGVVAVSADASDVFDSKIHSRDMAAGYGDTNSNRYANPEVDALIESSATTMDMKQRREMLQSVMRAVMDDLPIIPLFVPFELYGVRRDLVWEPRRDGMLRLAEMSRGGVAR